MMPSWWRKAQEAAGVARRTIKQMHPKEREVHDLTVEECTEVIEQINTSGVIDSEETWETLELTPTGMQVLWQGVTDMHFNARDRAGGDWSDVSHDRRFKGLFETLSHLSAEGEYRPCEDDAR